MSIRKKMKNKFIIKMLIFGISCNLLFSSCNKQMSEVIVDNNQALLNFKTSLFSVSENINKLSPDIKSNNSLMNQIIMENKFFELIIPLKESSIQLLKSFELYDSLNNVFENDAKSMIVAALFVFNSKKNTAIKQLNSEFRIKSYSQNSISMVDIDRGELNACLLEVFGLEAGVYGIFKLEGKIIVQNVLSLVAKVGLKSLTWMGIAYSVYNLTLCLMEADKN